MVKEAEMHLTVKTTKIRVVRNCASLSFTEMI